MFGRFLRSESGWRVEVYSQKCLKFFSETTVQLALFLFLLVPRFFIKNLFLEKQDGCMHILCEACSINYE